jgi:hypothetical protein
VAQEPQREQLKLKFVSVFIRHGLRTPIASLPKDKRVFWWCRNNQLSSLTDTPGGLSFQLNYHNDRAALPGNCYFGGLTEKGIEQIFQLGKKFRSIYVDKENFLSANFSPDEIYVRATDTRRTVHSAELFMSGLYTNLNVSSHIQNILAINVLENSNENMYPRGNCQRINQIRENQKKSDEYQNRIEQMKQMNSALSQWFDMDTVKPSWSGLYNTLSTMKLHGYGEMLKLDDAVIETLGDHAGWEMRYKYSNRELLSLGIGRFVYDFVHRMERVKDRIEFHKLALYSGHDNTLAPMLGIYHVYESNHVPPPGSSIVLELLSDDSQQHYVRFIYNDKVMRLPECDSLEYCPWDRFKELSLAKVPTDYSAQCKHRVEPLAEELQAQPTQ